MARVLAGCLVVCLFLNPVFSQNNFKIPDVSIEVLTPKGIRVSLPDVPKMSLFAFHGNLNKAIKKEDTGTIRGEVLKKTNGKWVFEDPNVTLKIGDEIKYYVFVSVDRVGYIKDNLVYRYTGSSGDDRNCRPSQTEVRGRSTGICSGEIIFEDHFDSLNDDKWRVEQYIPVDNNPEFPFVSYQRSAVSVVDGYLRIEPGLQSTRPGFDDMSILTGNLDLTSGCTSRPCSKQASGSDILPPVVSGRLISIGLAFTYGTVHIRAKVPQGDWLYPEMLLESFLKKYGSDNYASGVLKIASVRGNKDLKSNDMDFGNKVLYGGPLMDYKCRQTLMARKESSQNWGDDFHEYSVYWGPDRIVLSVDGSEWSRVEPASTGLSGRYTQMCDQLPRDVLAKGTKMAPFDNLFYITLGVSAGGISDFPDDAKSGTEPKPWRDRANKARLTFWNARDSWLDTWSQPALIVDYVKVVAL